MNAYFAGGCFWCITPVFADTEGVLKVTSGYCGGKEVNPTYEDVKAQKTGHRETIKVEYDENIVSFSQLLEIFLNSVNVYDDGGQFIDRGYSYTLAIYCNDDSEKQIVLNRLNEYKDKTYVSVEDFEVFYDAEDYHQDYYLKNPIEFEKELVLSGRKKNMKLINQNDYEDVTYITKTKKPDFESGLHTNIKTSGCGICCGMMVAQFFNEEMSLDEAIQLSYDYNANTSAGTKYKEYSLGLSEKFDLDVTRTDTKEDLFKCLDEGGCAVANVGGDHDDHLGVFSHFGHYIFILSHKNDEICILDPGIEKGKYEEQFRKGITRVEGQYVYSDVQTLLDDMTNREKTIFMYRKRKHDISYKKIFDKIDELNDEYVNIWKEVVEIESPTSFKEGVDKVGKYFINKAVKQGWDIEIEENEKAGNAICITMNANAKGKPIAISGHMDTVHPVGSMKTNIDGDKIYGPGCTDCKGGLIICLLAMKALKECGFIDRPIKFILQADEEVGSRLSNKKTIEFMCEKAKDCIAFLNTEMYVDNTGVTTRKGIRRYLMKVTGVAAHSSICQEGRSAILEASHKIIELEKMKQADDITINVGTINGGTTPNTVPAYCECQIDVRFNDESQMQEADKYIRDIMAKTYVDNTKTELELMSTRIAMSLKDYNFELLAKMNEVFRECGMSELTARKATGGSDAAYTSDAGIPTIDSIGVSGGFIHSKDEYANISSLAENAKRMAAVIYGIKD